MSSDDNTSELPGLSGDSYDGKINEHFRLWVEDLQLPPDSRKLSPTGLNIRSLRQNPLTKRWTLYGQSKSGGPVKPRAYQDALRNDPRALEQPDFDVRCPFCPGTEAERTPAEVCRVCISGELIEGEGLPERDCSRWLARAVRNKFPYFATPPDLYATSFPGEGTAFVRGELDNAWTNPWQDHPIYRHVDAFGASEVIIESPKHNGQLAVATGEQTFHALRVLAARGRTLSANSGCKQLAYFKQYGASAGGSLVHPHMQVHALPIITGSMLGTIKQHQAFFKEHGCCAVERLYIADVTASGSPGQARLVKETDHFVASVPYAAYHKGRVVIAPKRHSQRFEECLEAELKDLAELLQLVMSAVYRQRDDPHYHIFWETLPTPQGLAEIPDTADIDGCFRWMLHVRAVRNLMGITNASGADFAEFLPEQVAHEYRELINEEAKSPLRDQPHVSEQELLTQKLVAKEKEVAELKLKIEKIQQLPESKRVKSATVACR